MCARQQKKTFFYNIQFTRQHTTIKPQNPPFLLCSARPFEVCLRPFPTSMDRPLGHQHCTVAVGAASLSLTRHLSHSRATSLSCTLQGLPWCPLVRPARPHTRHTTGDHTLITAKVPSFFVLRALLRACLSHPTRPGDGQRGRRRPTRPARRPPLARCLVRWLSHPTSQLSPLLSGRAFRPLSSPTP